MYQGFAQSGACVSERLFQVNGREIREDGDAYVIAEVGHNHQGKLETALEMLEVAKSCGVNAIKLQKRDNRGLFTKALYDSPYQGENSYGDTYGEHREALEFGRDEFLVLIRRARELGLDFACTAFDLKSADFLREMGVTMFKTASGDLTNIPLLRHVASFGLPLVISTGGGSLEDVRRARDAVLPLNRNICILQCTAAYPCEAEDMNLRVIETYRQAFPDTLIGLSDHQNGISMSMVAYALGARVFEKHFTLNRAWRGTDHAFSLEPIGLRKLVRDLKRARKALGDGVKRRLPVEERPLLKMSKKLVAARDLQAGALLLEEHVAVKSPGDGLPPFALPSVLGRRLRVSLRADENITAEVLE